MHPYRQSSHRPFWITNISRNVISLGDLGVLIIPKQSVDLADPVRYPHLNESLIQASLKSGSLWRYSHKIAVRQVPPPEAKKLKGASKIPIEPNPNQAVIKRPVVAIQETKYEELQLSDEEYAKQNADLAEIDDVSKYKKG